MKVTTSVELLLEAADSPELRAKISDPILAEVIADWLDYEARMRDGLPMPTAVAVAAAILGIELT